MLCDLRSVPYASGSQFLLLRGEGTFGLLDMEGLLRRALSQTIFFGPFSIVEFCTGLFFLNKGLF